MTEPVASEAPKKRPRGRPLACETPELMAECIDRELEECLSEGRPVTLHGMMIACGIYSRSTFDEYERRPEFSAHVKRAKFYVAHAYEEKLSYDKPTGAIFALKNMGWKDTVSNEHTGKDGGALVVQVMKFGADDTSAG